MTPQTEWKEVGGGVCLIFYGKQMNGHNGNFTLSMVNSVYLYVCVTMTEHCQTVEKYIPRNTLLV